MEQSTGIGPLCLYPRSAAAFCGCVLEIGLMHYAACAAGFDSDTSPFSTKREYPLWVLSFHGAGYGSRTRLNGLGSRCNTDIPTLRIRLFFYFSTNAWKMQAKCVKGMDISFVVFRLCPRDKRMPPAFCERAASF